MQEKHLATIHCSIYISYLAIYRLFNVKQLKQDMKSSRAGLDNFAQEFD